MRKKIEEQLAKLAFGDLEADEAMNLELRAKDDPEAARTLETYCRMKEELRSLSLDVPADQLSKERLREAILTRGLERQKAASSRPTWLWMPAAAAVLAFGIVFVKGYHPTDKSASPMVVDNKTLSVPEIAPTNVVTRMKIDRSAIERVAKRAVAETQRPLYVMNTEPSHRSSRSSYIGDRHEGSDGLPGLPDGTYKPGMNASDPDASIIAGKTPDFTLDKTAAPASEVKKEAQPTVVLIQPETDKDTGTLKAKEIENTANVVIGG